MQTIRIYKAEPLYEDHIIEDLTVIVSEKQPDYVSLELQRQAHKAHATLFVDAIWHKLPGGLLDQILIELMSRKASYFSVPFSQEVER
jgi:hypothetical protein